MARKVVRVPLTREEMALVAERPAGVPASTWICELLQADLASSVPVLPVDHLSRAAADGFVSVSLGAELARAVRDRIDTLSLADHIRSLVSSSCVPSGGDLMPLPRPASASRSFSSRTPGGRPAPQPARGPSEVVERPHRAQPFEALEALHREFRLYRYDVEPPLIVVTRMDATGEQELRGAALGMFPGEALRLLVGIEPKTLVLHPMTEGHANAAWEAIIRTIRSTAPEHRIELTPTVFWVEEGQDGYVAWEGEDAPQAVLFVDVACR